MRSLLVLRILRATVSAGLSVLLVVGATYLPSVNHATVALVLVLLTLALSIQWGWLDALAASLAGGVAFDYYFLPPKGFGLEAPEHWLTLGAFLLTAITTGQLSAKAARNRAEAERRRNEMERLFRLGNALLENENAAGSLETLAKQIIEIFQARASAVFDQEGDHVFRSGSEDEGLSEAVLKDVAATGRLHMDASRGCCVLPIRLNGNLAGSLGIAGDGLSRSMAEAIAERVGVALARASAAQESVAAELARRSESLKSAVLDALAHEIKGPLATVKVSVSTLLSQKPGSAAQQRELLTIIDEESDRIARWIDNAIQISLSEAGQLRLDKKPRSLKLVIDHALRGLGPLVRDRQIDVRIPESLPTAAFDAEMIEKVVRLVLDNALKYSPPGSPVAVNSEFTGAEIVLSVEDHGSGIPENERERIFESHYRGSSARKGTPGTGLGLASARCIIEAHGGEIWVTSAAEGGSVFHISLPATINIADEQSQNLECG